MAKQNTFSVIFQGVPCHWAAKLISIFIRFDDLDSYLKILVFFNLTQVMSLSCEYRNVTLSGPPLGNRVTVYRVCTPHLKYLWAHDTFSFVTCQATQVVQQENLMTSKLLVKIQKVVCRILWCNYARVLLQKIEDSIAHVFWENFLKSFWKFSSFPWMFFRKFSGIGHLNNFVACIFSKIFSKCF